MCRRRGINNTFVGTIEQLANTGSGSFDAVLALGNNLGLIGSADSADQFFEAVLRRR